MPRNKSHFVKCYIPDCNGNMIAKGLCKLHYYRLRNIGTTSPKPVENQIMKFWKLINKAGPVHPVIGTKCWNYTGGKIRKGYGHIVINGSVWKTHRYMWTLTRGAIPESMIICHKCDNPSCVRPSHLFLGNSADNVADRNSKNRQARGKMVMSAKLVEADVRWILLNYTKDSSTHGSTAFAKMFNVSHPTILRIIKRETWKHILI